MKLLTAPPTRNLLPPPRGRTMKHLFTVVLVLIGLIFAREFVLMSTDIICDAIEENKTHYQRISR